MELELPANMSGIFVGSENNERVGTIVDLTDFNNDGIDDYVIAAEGGNGSSGAVHVVFGRTDPFPAVFSLEDLEDTEYVTLINSAPTSNSPMFGSQVATGDFNGDGLNDIAVSAPGDNSGGLSGDGVVSIFYGRTAEDTEDFLTNELGNPNVWDAQTLNGVDGENICGSEDGMRLGTLLENMGDMDGDGGDELAMGTGRAGDANNDLFIYYSNDDTVGASTAIDQLPTNYVATITGLSGTPTHAASLPFPAFDENFQLFSPVPDDGAQALFVPQPDIYVGLSSTGEGPGNNCVFNGMYLQRGDQLNVPDVTSNQAFMINHAAATADGVMGSAVRDLDGDGTPEFWLGYFDPFTGNALGLDWYRLPPTLAVDGSTSVVYTSIPQGVWNIGLSGSGEPTYGIEELGGTDAFNDRPFLAKLAYGAVDNYLRDPDLGAFGREKLEVFEELVLCGLDNELGSTLSLQFHYWTLVGYMGDIKDGGIANTPEGTPVFQEPSSPTDVDVARFALNAPANDPVPNAGVITIFRNFLTSDNPTLDANLLDGNNGYLVYGETSFGGTGWEMGYGDVNGDNIQDTVFSAPFSSYANDFTNGAVYTLLGGEKNMRALDHQDGVRDGIIFASRLNETPILRAGLIITTDEDFSEFGTSFAALGDVNGDGIADFGIGEPLADADGNTNSGRGVIIFGDHNYGVPEITLDTLTAEQGMFVNGVGVTEMTGGSIAGPRDVNGDGLNDILIGASRVDQGPSLGLNNGAGYVVYGQFSPALPLQNDLSSLTPSTGSVINGRDEGDMLGMVVSGIGDINADGRPDFALAAPPADPGTAPMAGEILVVFGQGTDLPGTIDPTDLDGTNGFVIQGAETNDLAGSTLSAAGDVNGDGIDDFVIGSPGEPSFGPGSEGTIDILFGTDQGFPSTVTLGAASGFRLIGDTESANLGGAVDASGDFDGDGVNDLVLGFPRLDAGGNNTGLAGVFSGASLPLADPLGTALDGLAFTTTRQQSFTGWTVAYAGDVNGDGFDDVLIGSVADGSSPDEGGLIHLVFGRPDIPAEGIDLDTLDGRNGYTFTGSVFGDDYGTYFGGIGDVDGDGFDDIALGIPGASSEDGKPGDQGCVVVVFGNGANLAALDNVDGQDGIIDYHNVGINFVESAVSLPGDGIVHGTFLDDAFGLGSVDYNGDYVTVGDDIIRLEAGDDFAAGFDGHDLIEGGAGLDILFGQAGNDTLDGGDGHDSLEGGEGNDSADGGDGNDTIDGGESNDTAHGGAGDDSILGGDGADSLRGGADNDTLIGGSENDTLKGETGHDVLQSGTGDDELSGGDGDDSAEGGEGADTLSGGSGNDTLRGDGGADTFVVNQGDEQILVADFQLGVDKLDLSAFSRADAANAFNAAQLGSAILTFSDGTVVTVEGNGVTPDTLSVDDLIVEAGNLAPEGDVVITGTATEGETLTANASGVSDGEGINAATTGFQWQRDGVAITGATGSSYTLTADDIGAEITVVFSYTDNFGTPESVTSDATDPVEASDAPTVGVPVIVGTAEEDQTLTVDLTGVSDADGINPATETIQWQRNGENVGALNDTSYTLDQEDVGATFTVVYAYTDNKGNPGGATSAATDPVANVNDPIEGPSTVTGVGEVGETLTVSFEQLSDPDGIDRIEVQWYRLFPDSQTSGQIPGATGTSYTITEDDLGFWVSPWVQVFDDFGNQQLRTNLGRFVNQEPTGVPTITGTVQEGETIGVDLTTINDPDGLQEDGVNYQWQRDGVDIPDATEATYTVTADDVLNELSVVVRYRDDANTLETVTSASIVAAGIPQLLIGTPEPDTLVGGNGNDTIEGLGSNDTLTGDRADDIIDGGEGIDTAVYSGSPTSYTVGLSASGVTVTDRRADGNGTDQLTNVERLDFEDVIPALNTDLLNLERFGGPAGLEPEALESFIELYIAYFNRAPDAIGLNFWGSRFADGRTLEQIAEQFALSAETQATYPPGTTTQAFVEAVYDNVLGRPADAAGLAFWIDKLDTGVFTRDVFILRTLAGAKSELKPELGEDFVNQQLADRKYLEDKTDIGAYYAVIRGMSDVEDAITAMNLFDGSDTSITDAVAAIDGFYADALDPDTGEFLMPLIGVLDDPFAVG